MLTSLDLKAAFHHIKVAQDTIPLLGVVGPKGLYRYKRMPFGLLSALLFFQYLMDRVTKGLEGTDPFQDDMTVIEMDLTPNWSRTLKVLARYVEWGLMVNLRKSRFLAPSIIMLGLEVCMKSVYLADKCLKRMLGVQLP